MKSCFQSQTNLNERVSHLNPCSFRSKFSLSLTAIAIFFFFSLSFPFTLASFIHKPQNFIALINLMDDNHFDRLSDDLIRLIFTRVLDADSLCSCLSVSKRFASIVPQINSVSLIIPNRTFVKQSDHSKLQSIDGGGGVTVNFLRILMSKFITKPLQFLHNIIARNSSSTRSSVSDDEDSFHSADEVLKSFNEIESLQIQLPSHGGEVGSDGSDSLLKWKAEFGSELKSCVILCATSFQKTEDFSDVNINNTKEHIENESSESTLGSDELKLRIMWTISCIIAASERHYSLKQMITNRPMLRKVVVTDEKKQGKLCMNEEQIVEMRSGLNSNSAALESSVERTRVPTLIMKMGHVRALELPVAGKVMKGATLVVIRAVDAVKKHGSDDDGDLLEGAFDGDMEEDALSEAVKVMMMKKNKTFTLEMD